MTVPLRKITLRFDDKDRPVVDISYGDNSEAEASSGDASEWLAAFAERLGDKSARFMRELVTMNSANGHVSLDDLATQLKVKRAEVDGWNRNLGRSINANIRDHGHLRPDENNGTAQLFDFKQRDDDVWLYSVPSEFRDALGKTLAGR